MAMNLRSSSNSCPYSTRNIRYIEALNKLKPFRIMDCRYTKQKYEIPHQVPEFMYYKGEDECDYDYDKFNEYKQIVHEFHQAFEQFKKNY